MTLFSFFCDSFPFGELIGFHKNTVMRLLNSVPVSSLYGVGIQSRKL